VSTYVILHGIRATVFAGGGGVKATKGRGAEAVACGYSGREEDGRCKEPS
jgi:hypothetical protein